MSFMSVLSTLSNPRTVRTAQPTIDTLLLSVTVCLSMFGLLMVYSASIALGDGPEYQGYGRYYFVVRHAIFMGLGLLSAIAVVAVPMKRLQEWALPLFFVGLILLALVLVPGIGREANGARRWIPLGIINLQPSELMKVLMLLYAADYTVRKQAHLSGFVRGLIPMIVSVLVVGALLLLEPDLGAFIVIGAIAMGLIFIGGLNIKHFALMTVGLLGSFFALIWYFPWRRQRLFVYLDPWNPDNVYGSAYQLSHSLIAFGRGEWFGVGLGASVEKLHYLPEAHTDFIAAVVGEELGFVGITVLVAVFGFIVWRCFEIGRQSIAMDRVFGAMVAYGVGVWFGVQTFINIGVSLGLLPTKGLTLPMVSYGGSAIVTTFVAIALVFRVDYENRRLMRGKSK